MIQFSNWTISAPCGEVIARQYDNLSRTLTVMGDLPAGWDWSMLVESGGNLNIISLSPVDGGVGVTLTADMIPYAGYYRMQLRGTQGEAVRHTNILTQVYIPPSLTGEGQWPDLPSEFEQIEERMQELAGQAQESADSAQQSASQAEQSAQEAKNAAEWVEANVKAAQDAADAAKASETNAKTSETNAAKSAGDAQTSAGQAADSATQAKAAQGKAEAAQTAAETAQGKAETAAGTATQAAQGAVTSAGQASQSAQEAASAATAAQNAQEAAEKAQGQAEAQATAAAGSATAAQESAAAAAGSSSSASGSAQTAQTAAQDAQKAQQAIEDMTVTSETLEPGSEATVTKTVSPGGVVNLEFGIPEGKPGTGDMMSDGSVPMTGALNMGGNRVTNVGAPTEPTDAVRQQDLEAVSQEVDHILDGTTPAYIPPATDTKLGGIIIGPGLSVAEDGTASALEINDAIITDANPWSAKKIVDTLAPEFETSGAVVTCTPVAGYPLHVVSQIMPVQEGEGDPSPDNVRPIRGWTDANLIVAGKNLFDVQNGIILKAYITSASVFGGNAFRTVAIRCIPGAVYTVSRAPITSVFSVGFTDSAPQTGSAIFSFAYESPDASSITITAPQNAKYLLAYIYNGNTTPEINVDDVLNSTQIEYGGTATSYEPYRGQTITLPFGKTVYGGTVDNQGNGIEEWGYIASYNGEELPGEWISDRDVYAPGTTPTIGAEVAYKLATPIPFTVTPQELNAVAGTNTIYSSTGDTTVSGRADPNTILQQLAQRIAALEGQVING